MNRNTHLNYQYTEQQQWIKNICSKLNVVAYYPNYHADKNDANTVLIYSKENHEFNRQLDRKNDYITESKPYILSLQNTDINGRFDLNFMNHGQLDLRGSKAQEQLQTFIQQKITRTS